MITIRNLTKTYFSKTGNVEALKPLNLDLPHSGFILLKGKSGSGKSTFLNLLGCLDEASSGSILFDGCDIASMNEKERNHFRSEKIGFCYQGDNLIPFLSVRENVFLETKNKEEEKLRTILENVDLKGFENRRCDELSGGQAQRVAIARAVYRDTVLLLCDEPTSALDGDSAKSVFECLKREAVDRLVLVASHDEEAETYADAIFELKDGVLRSVKEYAFDDRAISRNEKKKTGHAFSSWRLLLHPFRKTPIRASLSVLLLSLCFGITLPLLSNVLLNSNALLLREVSSSPEMASFYLTREEKVEAKLDDEQARFLENKIAGPKYRVYCNGNGIENGAYGPSLGSCFAVYPEKDSIDNYLFSPTGAGYLAFEETDWSFPIVFGRAPRDEKECLIPYCYFPCYQKYGFRGADGVEHEGKELLDPNTFFSFRPTLLAPISDGRKELEIVGFVDTGFSLEQYPASLKPTDAKNACLSAESTNRLAKGPHCLTIVSKDFINHHFKSPSLISSSGVGKSLTLKEDGVEFPFPSFFDETNSKAERLLKMKDGDGVFLTKPAFARFMSSFNIEIPSEKQIDYSSCLKLGSAFETGVTDARLSRFSYLMEGNSTGIYEPNRLLLLASGDYVRQNGLPEGKEREHLVALAKQAYQDAFLRHEVDSIPDFANPSSETYLRSFYVKALFEREILLKEGEVDALFLDELLRDIDKSQIETISLNFQHPIYGKGDFTANVIGVHLDEDGAICLRGEPLEKAKSIFDDSEKATRILFKPGLNKEILRYGLSNPELEGLIVRVSHPKIAAFDYARDYMIPGIQQTASVIGGVLGVIALALLTLNATTWTREREEEFLLRRSLGMKKARAYGEILLTTGLVFGVSMLISIPLGFGFSAFLEGFIFDLFHCSLALFGLNGWAFLIVLGVSVMVNAIAVLPSVIALGKKKLTRSFH